MIFKPTGLFLETDSYFKGFLMGLSIDNRMVGLVCKPHAIRAMKFTKLDFDEPYSNTQEPTFQV